MTRFGVDFAFGRPGGAALAAEGVTSVGSNDCAKIGGAATRQRPAPDTTSWRLAMQSQSTPDRFWAKVKFTNSCWLWTASLDRHGYGQFMVRPRLYRAHRWAYEFCNGEIPEGLPLDHLCRTHACVNPDHLEPVSHGENVRRGLRGRLVTHCSRGHAYTPENTFLNHGHLRECRACRNERKMSRYYANRDEINARRRAKRKAS